MIVALISVNQILSEDFICDRNCDSKTLTVILSCIMTNVYKQGMVSSKRKRKSGLISLTLFVIKGHIVIGNILFILSDKLKLSY